MGADGNLRIGTPRLTIHSFTMHFIVSLILIDEILEVYSRILDASDFIIFSDEVPRLSTTLAKSHRLASSNGFGFTPILP